MLEELRRQVWEANMELPKRELVTYTWGNASGICREKGLVVIKPSGVAYERLTPEMLVVMDLDGNKVEGELNPSSDTPTHLELYRAFSQIGGIVHTHSPYATAWAQAGRGIPCYGTTHADYFYGEIPCVRNLTPQEIEDGYERNTGRSIAEAFQGKNPLYVPGILCKNHGPFTWGRDGAEAVYHAVVLEEIARMNLMTEQLGGNRDCHAPAHMVEKHFARKHGPNAYYGQRGPAKGERVSFIKISGGETDEIPVDRP